MHLKPRKVLDHQLVEQIARHSPGPGTIGEIELLANLKKLGFSGPAYLNDLCKGLKKTSSCSSCPSW